MIDPKSTGWTQEEKDLAITVLEKIAYCQDQHQLLPSEIFEAHGKTKKNISTGLVLFRGREIYLIQRPDRDENPCEPYPMMWHNPGKTHAKNDLTEEALVKIVEQELGLNYAQLLNVRQVRVNHYETPVPPREMYLFQVFVAHTRAEPKNPKGKFFPFEAIPWDDIIPMNRDSYIKDLVEVEMK